MITLREHASPTYGPRTRYNAARATLTIAFVVDGATAGERLTRHAAADRYLAIAIATTPPETAADSILQVLRANPPTGPCVLNIAGNGLATLTRWGWDQDRITDYMTTTLRRVRAQRPLFTVISGGQTGADMAGLIAAHRLGLDAVGTWPQGWRQRGADGHDRPSTRAVLEQTITAISPADISANPLTEQGEVWDNQDNAARRTPRMTKLSDQSWCCLDTETTGPDPATARVIQAAWRCQLGWTAEAMLAAIPQVTMVALPPGPGIPPSASAVHHLVDADLRGAPSWSIIQDRIAADLHHIADAGAPPPILVAFNSPYDRAFFANHPLGAAPWVDVMRLAVRTWHIGQVNDGGWPLTSFKQQEIRYWLGVPPVAGIAHTADADIAVTALIFERAIAAYLDDGHPDDVTAFRAWLDSPIPHVTIPFGERAIVGKRFEDLTDDQLSRMTWAKAYYRDAYVQWNLVEMATTTLRDRASLRTEDARRQMTAATRPPGSPTAFRPVTTSSDSTTAIAQPPALSPSDAHGAPAAPARFRRMTTAPTGPPSG